MPEQRPFQDYHTQRFTTPDKPLNSEQLPVEIRQEDGMRVFDGQTAESYMRQLERVQGQEAVEGFQHVLEIARLVKQDGGRALLVGGGVRDEVLGMPSKDFDVEVYGISLDRLQELLASRGRVEVVGQSFGVLLFTAPGGFNLDISIPRRDSKVGEGHKGFVIEPDPSMSMLEAMRRRDFTINAMAKDPLTGEIYDGFGGVDDLAHRRLRVTDRELFADDPLRVLRAAQFVARFGLRPEPDTIELVRSVVPEMASLSRERFGTEWAKLLMKADRPSAGLHALHEFGVIEQYYPELLALRDTPQEFEWHPEGDVWTHTLMVVDEAARVARTHELEGVRHRYLMYAALCHDLGKPSTTKFEEGRLRSKAHEPAGEEPTRSLLARLGVNKDEIETIVKLVKDHLWPGEMYRKHQRGEPVTEGAFRRLAKRLHPATIEDLTYVMEADAGGRGPFVHERAPDQILLPFPDKAGAWTREQARAYGLDREKPKPVLQGRDLLGFGFKPGEMFGRIIAAAEELRDEGVSREVILLLLEGSGSAQKALERLSKNVIE